MMFLAGCRLWALDGLKEFSLDLWNEHFLAVQKVVFDRAKRRGVSIPGVH